MYNISPEITAIGIKNTSVGRYTCTHIIYLWNYDLFNFHSCNTRIVYESMCTRCTGLLQCGQAHGFRNELYLHNNNNNVQWYSSDLVGGLF